MHRPVVHHDGDFRVLKQRVHDFSRCPRTNVPEADARDQTYLHHTRYTLRNSDVNIASCVVRDFADHFNDVRVLAHGMHAQDNLVLLRSACAHGETKLQFLPEVDGQTCSASRHPRPENSTSTTRTVHK